MEGVKKVFNIGEEQKELVDPYFVFSFAGKEVCRLTFRQCWITGKQNGL